MGVPWQILFPVEVMLTETGITLFTRINNLLDTTVLVVAHNALEVSTA